MQKINKNYTFDNLIISNNNHKTIEILKGMNTSASINKTVRAIDGAIHLTQSDIYKK